MAAVSGQYARLRRGAFPALPRYKTCNRGCAAFSYHMAEALIHQGLQTLETEGNGKEEKNVHFLNHISLGAQIKLSAYLKKHASSSKYF